MNLYRPFRSATALWVIFAALVGGILVIEFYSSNSIVSLESSFSPASVVLEAQTGQSSELITTGPTNPAFAQPGVKILVDRAGMQEIRGSELITAGLGTALPLFQLHHLGSEVAIEVLDTDGVLDETTKIRFYAPHRKHSMRVGDHWNSTAVYWLTSGTQSELGLRMASRSVVPNITIDPPVIGTPIIDPPGPEPPCLEQPCPVLPLHTPLDEGTEQAETTNASVQIISERSTGYQSGIWEKNEHYVSQIAGYDEDEFFAERFVLDPSTADPIMQVALPELTVLLEHTLPLASLFNDTNDFSTFEFSAAPRSVTTHTMQISFTNSFVESSWANAVRYEPWLLSFTTPEVTDELTVRFLPGLVKNDIYFDKVYWTQPVSLSFEEKGAEFIGVDGNWVYQLTGVAQDGILYDVTVPNQPVILIKPPGANPRIQDGPKPRSYALVTGESVHTPQVEPYRAGTFDDIIGSDVFYIAPPAFHMALNPLLELRKSQGYHPAVIDLQQIFDAWSFGYSAPEAIRRFLQHATALGQPVPIAAVLVGDTTVDPLNHLGWLDGNINFNHVPTYMEHLDPISGVMPCDNCLAQLDGESPFSPMADPNADIDLWIGRLPVSDAAQLTTLIDKLIRYETVDLDADWRSTSLFIADNYVRLNCTVDKWGNFAELADTLIMDWQAPEIATERLYYDPRSRVPQDCEHYSSIVEPWQEPNADVANQRLIEHLSTGPGLVTFVGNSNYAYMGPVEDAEATTRYILEFDDVPEIMSEGQPFIGLQATSYTSRFTNFNRLGLSMDERQLLHPSGGAVATWGSSGFVAPELALPLMEGFHQALWEAPALSAPMGQLVAAGLARLPVDEDCCKHLKYAYTLLGDPLMRAGVKRPNEPVETPTPIVTATDAPTEIPTTGIPPTDMPTLTPTPDTTVAPTGTTTPMATPSVIPTSTPTPRNTPLPQTASLVSNFGDGAPGSYFVLMGSEFIPNQEVEIRIYGNTLGTVIADGEGTFIVLIEAEVWTPDGEYDIVAVQAGVIGSAGATASTLISIDATTNVRTSPVDPDDPNVPVISLLHKLYLPSVQ